MENRTFDEKTDQILKGLEKAYEKMVKFKKYKGTPLVVSDGAGGVKKIPAEDIPPTAKYTR